MAAPFSVPFRTSARDGNLWIRPEWASQESEVLLQLKGASWSGFQLPETRCPEDLGNVPLEGYIGYLRSHDFNAVRLPLYAQGVLDNAEVKWQRCIPYRRTGRNRGMHTSTYLAVLHDIIRRLAANGIFVILDMHGIVDRSNTRLWCDESSSGGTGCTKGNEGKLQDAWLKLADSLCETSPNVIMAELYNEPWGATWGGDDVRYDWRAAAERLGNMVLSRCPRWLIGVQGVGSGSGECRRYADTQCWWGENVMGHLELPLSLHLPDRLVLCPHIYGHGDGKDYLSDASFPDNMPRIWDQLWGRIPAQTGTPILITEWGGHMSGRVGRWQWAVQRYLRHKNISSIYWALNSNGATTGGLYPDAPSEKHQMLSGLPASSITSLQADFATIGSPPPAASPSQPPPPSPPRSPPHRPLAHMPPPPYPFPPPSPPPPSPVSPCPWPATPPPLPLLPTPPLPPPPPPQPPQPFPPPPPLSPGFTESTSAFAEELIERTGLTPTVLRLEQTGKEMGLTQHGASLIVLCTIGVAIACGLCFVCLIVWAILQRSFLAGPRGAWQEEEGASAVADEAQGERRPRGKLIQGRRRQWARLGRDEDFADMISNEKAAGADVVAVGQEQRAEQPMPSSRRTQDTHTIAHADHGRRGEEGHQQANGFASVGEVQHEDEAPENKLDLEADTDEGAEAVTVVNELTSWEREGRHLTELTEVSRGGATDTWD